MIIGNSGANVTHTLKDLEHSRTEPYQIWQTTIPLSAKFLLDWGGRLICYNSFKMSKEGHQFGYVTANLLVGFLADLVMSKKSRVGHKFLSN